jgi:FtsP/CotA-like multicopper oxidase with cupredoxin domain
MHTHGHTFRVVEHAGLPFQAGHLLDTVWLGPQEEATVAFVADNPGDWLFHCHMLSHAAAGMSATFRVA